MLKKLSKTIKAAFLCLFLSSIFISISPVLAIDPIQFEPQVEIPTTDSKDKIGGPVGKQVKGTDGKMYNSSDLLPRYIKAIYQYAIGAVGILAAVVMMYGGTLWILSMGNAERSTDAKSWIFAALSGLVLTLSAYSILYVVNPDLLNFKSLRIESIKGEKIPEKELNNTFIIANNTESDARKECNNKCGSVNGHFWVKSFDKRYQKEFHYQEKDGNGKGLWDCVCHNDFCNKPGHSTLLETADECTRRDGVEGFCYEDKCLIGKGKNNEVCGPSLSGRCKDASFIKKLIGGRDCESGLYCVDPSFK